ncbi:PREDICTED: uncharacterized protein LOC106111868 [Papilio polytes]|uniref:uncharacterized protein LOC106111868 n=1 Tax=Papilio polytes TaxID=76194 RepID=UPI0006765127|nr:PREDICTED: uncharacterized protein LOC106111868 [Papilio polytes]
MPDLSFKIYTKGLSCTRNWTYVKLLFKQLSLNLRGVRVVLLCALVAALVSAQLTFSRDWSAGKRAPAETHFDCSQFAHICRQFIHDLKQSFGKVRMNKHRKAERDDLSWDYEDDEK